MQPHSSCVQGRSWHVGSRLHCWPVPVPASRHCQIAAGRCSAASKDHEGRLVRHSPGAAALFTAAAIVLGTCGCPAVAAAQQLPLLYSNPAVLDGLRTLNKQQKFFGSEAPGEALVSRFKQASAQLQRFETLVRIGQWDSARLQLREGAFKQLRLDLGYGQEAYRLITPQMVREAVEGVEQLDRALKQQKPLEDIRPILTNLQQQLDALCAAVEPLQDIR